MKTKKEPTLVQWAHKLRDFELIDYLVEEAIYYPKPGAAVKELIARYQALQAKYDADCEEF